MAARKDHGREGGIALADLARGKDRLTLTWADGRSSAFHFIWLRDNCRCEACGDPEIGRRLSRLKDIPLEIAPVSAEIEAGQYLLLRWPDGHKSRFEAPWLRANAYDEASRRARAFQPILWNAALRAAPPRLAFEEVVAEPAAFLSFLEKLRDYGLCFLEGGPAEPGTLERLAGKIGPPQESNFGRIQDLQIDGVERSIANSFEALKLHTDEPYRASPPGLLIFHCIETDREGDGQSLFLDGFEIAEALRKEDPEGFALLSRHALGHRRHFAGDVDLIAEFPLLSCDAFGNLTGIRLNDRVAAPPLLPEDAVAGYYRAYRRLLELAEDERRMIHLTLAPGSVVAFDNHRILHGRSRLALKGRRWLQWAQVERGDFHSRLRIIADELQLARDARPLLRGAYG